jgi:membrane protease YdiL (CAAX protease family)
MAGVWSGLGQSPFLAHPDDRERDPLRLVGAVVGGLFVAVLAAVACWALVMIAYTLALGWGDQGLGGLGRAAQTLIDPNRNGLLSSLARLAVAAIVDGGFLLAFAACAAAVARQPLRRYVTAAPHIRGRLLLVGMALAVLALAPLVVAERALGGGPIPILAASPTLAGRVVYGAASLLLIPAAAAEELVFRGWLLRRTAAFNAQTGLLVVFTGILFAAAHFDFNPDAFLTRALMGAGFAYMTLRLGGIEFSSGVHAAHNMLIVLFLQPINLQAEPATISAFSLLEDLSLLVGYFIITEVVVHSSWLRDWAGVRRGELSPPDDRPHLA